MCVSRVSPRVASSSSRGGVDARREDAREEVRDNEEVPAALQGERGGSQRSRRYLLYLPTRVVEMGGEEGDDSAAIRRRDADFPALSPSAAAGKAAEKRSAPLMAAHKRAAETSKLPVGAKPFDPNMAKAILAGMRDGDPNEK